MLSDAVSAAAKGIPPLPLRWGHGQLIGHTHRNKQAARCVLMHTNPRWEYKIKTGPLFDSLRYVVRQRESPALQPEALRIALGAAFICQSTLHTTVGSFCRSRRGCIVLGLVPSCRVAGCIIMMRGAWKRSSLCTSEDKSKRELLVLLVVQPWQLGRPTCSTTLYDWTAFSAHPKACTNLPQPLRQTPCVTKRHSVSAPCATQPRSGQMSRHCACCNECLRRRPGSGACGSTSTLQRQPIRGYSPTTVSLRMQMRRLPCE